MNVAARQAHPVALRAEGLSKLYGSAWALRNVSLSVAAGETVAVFGANGTGKSTLIRLLATLITPTAGTLQVVGYDTTRYTRLVRRALGVLAHQSYLYQDLTAAENLRLYAKLYGLNDIEKQVVGVLKMVGLAASAEKRVRELSRGMQQRLALARSVIHLPAVWLLDEPDSGLDANGVQCLKKLLDAGRDQGQTVVLTTHQLELGLALSHRALVLARGSIYHSALTGDHSVEEWRSIVGDADRGVGNASQ